MFIRVCQDLTSPLWGALPERCGVPVAAVTMADVLPSQSHSACVAAPGLLVCRAEMDTCVEALRVEVRSDPAVKTSSSIVQIERALSLRRRIECAESMTCALVPRQNEMTKCTLSLFMQTRASRERAGVACGTLELA